MTEGQRGQFIQYLSESLKTTSFSVSFDVKEKPEGIKIIFELTREQMDAMTKQMIKARRKQ